MVAVEETVKSVEVEEEEEYCDHVEEPVQKVIGSNNTVTVQEKDNEPSELKEQTESVSIATMVITAE